MTNYHWTGASSTASTTAGNWNPSGVPGASDVVIFDNQATQDCLWSHTATGASITVAEIIIESNFAHNLQLNAVPTVKGMSLNKNIKHGTASQVEFRSGPISSGGYKTYNSKYLLIGDSANYPSGRSNLTFDFYAASVCAFDDGEHPIIRLNTGDFTPKYTTPTGTSGLTDFHTLSIGATVSTFQPDVSITADDKTKHFKMSSGTTTQFVCSIATVNWGASTVEFTGVSSGTFNLPVSLTTTYNSGNFDCFYRKIILSANTAGHRIDMEDNRYVSLEEFEIGDGLLFVGPRGLDKQGSDIRTVLPPKIRGSWSFSSISDGIYRSPREGSGPMPRVRGNFHITGKLDVDGLIDPTGLELTPQGSNPGGVAANTLWLNSGDSNKLYQGSSAVGGGGGGGSGTVTSVAVTGSDGIEVDSGSPITTSGTIALGVNKTNMLSHLNVEDGADVTDATNVTAAGALMDSELTDLAGVKGVTISTLQPKPSEGAFANGDKTKLDGIAAGATAYTDANAIAAVEGEATLALTGDVTIASGKGLTVDTNTLKVDATNNRVGIGQASPTTTLHVESSGTAIGLVKSSGGHANLRVERASNQYDAALLFYTGGSLGWRVQESGSSGNPGNDLYIIDQDGTPDTARMRFHDAGTVEVSQAFQQGSVTSNVLVADANGVLTAASALQDLAYLRPTQAQGDQFTPTTSAPFWASPPTTIQEAIDRLAAYTAQEIAALGGAPVIP